MVWVLRRKQGLAARLREVRVASLWNCGHTCVVGCGGCGGREVGVVGVAGVVGVVGVAEVRWVWWQDGVRQVRVCARVWRGGGGVLPCNVM